MSHSYVTVTDQFCGAGGSSIGARAAGAELKLALNHWKLAVETHNTNFPDALHECTDISACDPRRYPSTDILITSPECVNHSLAKGKSRKHQGQPDLFGTVKIDPAAERSRATMWDVPRFAERHGYQIVVVENVVEARHWVLWDAWLHAMQLLGYDHECVYFNSMFAHPTPQSRDRMYVVFGRQGNPKPDLHITPLAWCEHCDRNINAAQSWKNLHKRWGKYRQQYIYRCPDCQSQVEPYYYAAMNAIDWTLEAPRIGNRQRSLKERTLQRIRVGLEKLGRQPILMDRIHSGHNDRHIDMVWPTTVANRTQIGQPTHALIVPPFIVALDQSRGNGLPVRDVNGPWPTQTTAQSMGVVVPPFLVNYYGTGQASSLDNPIPTVPTRDRHGLVVPPFLVSYYTRVAGIRAAIAGMEEPTPTVPGRAVHYLAQPGETSVVEDCGFRMLQPHEIHKAMAFPDGYVVLGNQREKVRQYGNAVTPPVMQMLMERCIATLRQTSAVAC